ncbi:MAG TPA: redoxin domain-containing protein [Planctomycetes bacterium]|nr:redoxin domain-containing protein [Planctomycetota bacterium]
MLQKGQPVPAFEILDHRGETIRNTDLLGKRWLLWFYPKADTPG